MTIAESLYNKGLLSYPRTETTVFHPSIYVKNFVKVLLMHPKLGSIAANVMEKFNPPWKGSNDDKSHPPIHPVNYNATILAALTPAEVSIYDLVSRHFLSCVS